MWRNAFSDEAEHVLGTELDIATGHEGLGDFLAVSVVHADHGGVGDPLVAQQNRFQLGGRDLSPCT